MVGDNDSDVIVGDGTLTAIAPELRDHAPGPHDEAARLLAQGLRHAALNLQLVLPATESAPGTARRAVAELAVAAGASELQLDAIRTVVSEAVTNVVRHAYDAHERGLIHLDAAVTGTDLTILVVDDGHGPRVPSADPGLGLGWKLLAQLTDRWAVIQRGAGGTTVYMRVNLGRRPLTVVPGI